MVGGQTSTSDASRNLRAEPREPARRRAWQLLGDVVVHLPVTSDKKGAPLGVAESSASTPGRAYPCTSSMEAPPPVEINVIRSARSNLLTAATLSPPPMIGVRVDVGGHGVGHSLRAGLERRHLEHAHGAVPEHGLGLGHGVGVELRRLGPDIDAHQIAGNIIDRNRSGSASSANRSATPRPPAAASARRAPRPSRSSRPRAPPSPLP